MSSRVRTVRVNNTMIEIETDEETGQFIARFLPVMEVAETEAQAIVNLQRAVRHQADDFCGARGEIDGEPAMSRKRLVAMIVLFLLSWFFDRRHFSWSGLAYDFAWAALFFLYGYTAAEFYSKRRYSAIAGGASLKPKGGKA